MLRELDRMRHPRMVRCHDERQRQLVRQLLAAHGDPPDVAGEGAFRDDLELPVFVLDEVDLVLGAQTDDQVGAQLEEPRDEAFVLRLGLDPGGELHRLALLVVVAGHPVELRLVHVEDAALT
jgi:hypothetical protein